ncbi:glycosyltransferase family 2 protein [Mesorhizobium sp. M7A.F.Ca.US.001.01.1.1]|uniref:glycosyltransferase family 2 protein n=2 Tax=Mesorhizobium TaxID=68287 RepID=UPI00047FE212|nr:MULTISPECIES: glycosyltransferase family 2 protein [unclassified Mesorhizobium]RUY36500.1 glycosyltransferase family 2 protein [Mesorhizobium sp. M7A.F.Ca.US.001.04.1.1]RVA53088.1 glycosyltransferase family 2 protein [Mesorhizobium sp. M7A.F.Ca.US.001.01.1.1]
MTRFSSPVSALVICMNEADMIGECLESVDFCAEIIVVDSGSTDSTLDVVNAFIAKGYPIRLFHNDWPGFPRQRQFALDQATQPWCLSIEADEAIDDVLRQSITSVTQLGNDAFDGWYIRRRDKLKGYGYAHRWVLHNRLLRLFRRDKATMDLNLRVHESFEVPGETGTIENGVLLHRREMTIAEDLARANTYSSLKVATLVERAKKPGLIRLVLSPLGNFLKFYLAKRYFLCGRHGFVYSMLVMVYSFATEAKLYEAWRDNDRV